MRESGLATRPLGGVLLDGLDDDRVDPAQSQHVLTGDAVLGHVSELAFGRPAPCVRIWQSTALGTQEPPPEVPITSEETVKTALFSSSVTPLKMTSGRDLLGSTLSCLTPSRFCA